MAMPAEMQRTMQDALLAHGVTKPLVDNDFVYSCVRGDESGSQKLRSLARRLRQFPHSAGFRHV
jgi:hypothetical protein